MDYSDLGFKCGLEVHQRLNTRKLFCSCYCDPNKLDAPSEARKLVRRLRAVGGELGITDPSAAFEASREKEFTYLMDEKTACAVEMDEEPPHPVNSDALLLSLTFSKMLNSRILDEVFVMRKTVIDGSAVSGFQRTALIALDGKINTSRGEVHIPTLALEEESSGIVEKKAETIYRLDRQGIPLIEIATSPDLKDGVHAQEVAELLGQLLRSTGKVQRGLGSIRQDLNVSISAGARVEIKGVQDLKLIPKIIQNEVGRQINLLKIRKELQTRHILLGNEHFSPIDISTSFTNTKCKLIHEALKRKERVFGMKLTGFSEIFKTNLMPSYAFGGELAAYVKAHTPARGIMHSDEPLEKKYGIGEEETASISDALHVKTGDLFVICIGKETVCRSALKVAFQRCVQLQEAVPEETRRAENEISIFMRPLPGSARMYPETDLPPIPITKELLTKAEKAIPESAEEKRKRYRKWEINDQLIEKMLKSQENEAFETLVKETNASPQLIAITLLETLVSLRREGLLLDKLSDDLRDLFKLSSKFTKAAIPELLKLKCKHPTESIESLMEKHSLKKYDSAALKKLISTLEGSKEKKFAEIMKKHRLQVDAQELKRLLDSS